MHDYVFELNNGSVAGSWRYWYEIWSRSDGQVVHKTTPRPTRERARADAAAWWEQTKASASAD